MRRMNLIQLLKNTGAFVAVSASAVDAGLLLANRTGVLDVPGAWYINGPLAVWFVAGIPVSIALAERLMHQVNPKPGRIIGFQEGGPSPVLRSIRLNAGGKTTSLLAHVVPSIFGDKLPPERVVHRPAMWYVPVDGNPVVVRESELRAFLDAAYRRDQYQFSRPYWTENRRPPLDRGKYEAFMRLLVEAGLVEGRHPTGGASGRLVTHPRHAITFLKFESAYAVAR